MPDAPYAADYDDRASGDRIMRPLRSTRIFIMRSVTTSFLTVCLLVLFFSPGFASSTINNIRYSVHLDNTRIVLDLSRRASYQIVSFKNPDRIAINLKRVKIGNGVQPPRISGGIVEKVRINQLTWGSQIVLDLRGKAGWKDFALPKAENRSDRIVLDVYPSKAPAGKPSGTGSNGGKSSEIGKSVTGAPAAPDGKKIIVAIDPGHGGMDPGARGKYGLTEKYLVLDYAKRIAKEINKHQGFEAVLTRTRDVYLTLADRTEIAQQKGADIFVSIHMNSAPNSKAQGAEVWFLSPAGAAAKASKLMSNKQRAESELGLKKGHSKELLSLILDVNQQAMMHRSSLLAEEILRAMRKRGFPPSRGVRQKAWAVCKAITMPSVLVETGFISNAKDAKFLKSEKGRSEVSKAIASGVISFLKRYPPPSTSKRNVIVHKVKKGETLWRISKLYGSSVASIRKINELGQSSTLHPGQVLLITN